MSEDVQNEADETDEVEELVEELEGVEAELEAAMEEIGTLKAKVSQLEEEKEMENWEEWGKMAGHNLTRDDLQSMIGQARVSEDALIVMFRRGVTAGIELMRAHVERHIDDFWKPYADTVEE